MNITQTTSCDGAVIRVNYTADGPYITIDGAPAPAVGQLVIARGDHVAHVIAVDSAPLGERLSYVVINGSTSCPATVLPTTLALTGSHTDVLASIGFAFLICGLGLKRLARYVKGGRNLSFTK